MINYSLTPLIKILGYAFDSEDSVDVLLNASHRAFLFSRAHMTRGLSELLG